MMPDVLRNDAENESCDIQNGISPRFQRAC